MSGPDGGGTPATATPDPEDYRERARAWMETNLERRADRDARSPVFGSSADKTVEQIAAERRLQRRLYDAGWAAAASSDRVAH